MMTLLPSCFDEKTNDWWFTLPESSRKNVKTFTEAFQTRFDRYKNNQASYSLLKNRKQKPGEDTMEFIDDMAHLCRNLGLQEKHTVQMIIEALRPEFRPATSQQNLATLKDLRDHVGECHTSPEPTSSDSTIAATLLRQNEVLSKISALLNLNQPVAPVQGHTKQTRGYQQNSYRHTQSQQQRTQTNQSCRNCGEFHFRSQCKAKGKQCFKCGKSNHFAKVCRSARQGKQQ